MSTGICVDLARVSWSCRLDRNSSALAAGADAAVSTTSQEEEERRLPAPRSLLRDLLSLLRLRLSRDSDLSSEV